MRAFLIWTMFILCGTVWLQHVANGYKEQAKARSYSTFYEYAPKLSYDEWHYQVGLDKYGDNELNGEPTGRTYEEYRNNAYGID